MRRLAPLLAALLFPVQASATPVTNLGGFHRSGQTFLTWNSPPGPGWTYRLYRSNTPIVTPTDLDGATLVGSVGDSTWCDRRLTGILGSVHGYSIDSLGAPLDATRGLFVVTPATTGSRYYAVTAQAGTGPEDRSIAFAGNSLTTAVIESPDRPRPVYQCTLSPSAGVQMEVYSLWTSPTATPYFPAMANRHGLTYDCGLCRGGTGTGSWHALAVSFHVRMGDFFHAWGGTGMAGEWVLAVDDFVRNNGVANTWWFGYHETFNTEAWLGDPPPTSGVVGDYTRQRVVFTIEWALDNFPVDRSRVYAIGSSMGGIGATLFAFWRPDLIAAAFAVVPRVNFSLDDDPNAYDNSPWICDFNAGHGQRQACEREWGTLSTNLMGPEGRPVYDWMNAEVMAAWRSADGAAPIVAFNGRQDAIIGWAEKPFFYEAMRQHRHGGRFFWDTRNHNSSSNSPWYPMQQLTQLYAFRGDRSYPALSNCSADDDAGDGTLASGDTLGSINGFVRWDTTLTDTPSQWWIRLTLADLASRWGPVPAPESLTVDVTPRRLQGFSVTPGGSYAYEVRRVIDGAVVRTGNILGDSLGLITVPAVPVYKHGGSALTVASVPSVDVPAARGVRPWLVLTKNPVRDALDLEIQWPVLGPAEVALFDLNGRRLQSLFDQPVTSRRMSIHARVAERVPGVYFVRARQDGRQTVLRAVVVR